jgi:hypothetical protein
MAHYRRCLEQASFESHDSFFSTRFPSVARAIDALPDETSIDGEVVAVDESGRPSFSSLQNLDRAPVCGELLISAENQQFATHRL